MADEQIAKDVEIVLGIPADIILKVDGKPVQHCTGFELRASADGGLPVLTLFLDVFDGVVKGKAIVETVENVVGHGTQPE